MILVLQLEGGQCFESSAENAAQELTQKIIQYDAEVSELGKVVSGFYYQDEEDREVQLMQDVIEGINAELTAGYKENRRYESEEYNHIKEIRSPFAMGRI